MNSYGPEKVTRQMSSWEGEIRLLTLEDCGHGKIFSGEDESRPPPHFQPKSQIGAGGIFV